MIENNVVLPAPFGPISAVMRPVSAVERRLVHGEQAAEAPGDVLDAEQGLSHGRAPRRVPNNRRRRSAKMPAMPRGAKATTTISTLP